ncbi:hypothetical protein BDB01DRAFT_906830 [Pilobolus umbonatus]|nr:hypothetical protein BDB01DRAFT_906830 [Pilobolus umbonatus]
MWSFLSRTFVSMRNISVPEKEDTKIYIKVTQKLNCSASIHFYDLAVNKANGLHDHPLPEDMSIYAIYRKQPPQIIKKIYTLLASGNKDPTLEALNILNILKKDIQNIQTIFMKDITADRASTLKELEDVVQVLKDAKSKIDNPTVKMSQLKPPTVSINRKGRKDKGDVKSEVERMKTVVERLEDRQKKELMKRKKEENEKEEIESKKRKLEAERLDAGRKKLKLTLVVKDAIGEYTKQLKKESPKISLVNRGCNSIHQSQERQCGCSVCIRGKNGLINSDLHI